MALEEGLPKFAAIFIEVEGRRPIRRNGAAPGPSAFDFDEMYASGRGFSDKPFLAMQLRSYALSQEAA